MDGQKHPTQGYLERYSGNLHSIVPGRLIFPTATVIGRPWNQHDYTFITTSLIAYAVVQPPIFIFLPGSDMIASPSVNGLPWHDGAILSMNSGNQARLNRVSIQSCADPMRSPEYQDVLAATVFWRFRDRESGPERVRTAAERTGNSPAACIDFEDVACRQ